jgi:hypothetical protein
LVRHPWFFAGKPIHFAVQERSGFEARSVREMMFGLRAHHMTHMAGIHWLKKVIRAYICASFLFERKPYKTGRNISCNGKTAGVVQ